MKNKVVKEITIGGFIIPLVLYMSVFLIIIFEDYVLPRYNDWQWEQIEKRHEQEQQRLEQEKAEKLAEFRAEKPREFVQYLQHNCRYFSGTHYDSKVQYLFEVQIENDVPVVYAIDFHNDEKIIKEKTILNTCVDEMLYHNSNYYYEYTFLGDDYEPRITFDYNDKDEAYDLHALFESMSCTAHESKNIDEILEALSKRITETQTRYAGEYEYESTKIIQEHGNKEYYGRKIETAQKISVLCTDTGNLYAHYSFDNPRDNYEESFFIDDNTDGIISDSIGDGHAGSFNSRWYFEEDYIIHHWYSDRGYFEGGDGYTIEYKLYFKKRAGT